MAQPVNSGDFVLDRGMSARPRFQRVCRARDLKVLRHGRQHADNVSAELWNRASGRGSAVL